MWQGINRLNNWSVSYILSVLQKALQIHTFPNWLSAQIMKNQTEIIATMQQKVNIRSGRIMERMNIGNSNEIRIYSKQINQNTHGFSLPNEKKKCLSRKIWIQIVWHAKVINSFRVASCLPTSTVRNHVHELLFFFSRAAVWKTRSRPGKLIFAVRKQP